MAASHPNVELVDAFQFSEAAFADPHRLRLQSESECDLDGALAAGTHQFAPNEIAFFDGEHPTSAVMA